MDVVEQALRDVAADEGMSHEEYAEHRLDYEDYLDSMAEMEAERHGYPHVDRPCRDAIMRRRMRHNGGTLQLPEKHRGMVSFTNGLMRQIAEFNSTGDVRIDELGWCDGPMTSDADFTPVEEGF